MTLKLNTVKFERDLRHLAKMMNQGMRQALDGQAKLFVRDCMKATPPFTPGKNWTESYGTQKKVGVEATSGQVNDLFTPLVDLRVYKEDVSGSGGRVGRSLRKLAKAERFAEMIPILAKIGIKATAVTREADRTVHNLNRNKRGRVRRGARILVAVANTVRKMVSAKVKNVGLAKSGWNIAAIALKVPVPVWVRRHVSRGIFVRGGSDNSPTITVGNAVPFIQQSGMELGIMQWAMKNRVRNIEKQVAQVARAQARKARAL